MTGTQLLALSEMEVYLHFGDKAEPILKIINGDQHPLLVIFRKVFLHASIMVDIPSIDRLADIWGHNKHTDARGMAYALADYACRGICGLSVQPIVDSQTAYAAADHAYTNHAAAHAYTAAAYAAATTSHAYAAAAAATAAATTATATAATAAAADIHLMALLSRALDVYEAGCWPLPDNFRSAYVPA